MLQDCLWGEQALNSTSFLYVCDGDNNLHSSCSKRHTSKATRWHVPQAVQTSSCSLMVKISAQGTVTWIILKQRLKNHINIIP